MSRNHISQHSGVSPCVELVKLMTLVIVNPVKLVGPVNVVILVERMELVTPVILVTNESCECSEPSDPNMPS